MSKIARLPTMGLLFTARISYQSEDDVKAGVEHGTTLDFRDNRADDALDSVFRWWDARHEAIPDIFHNLLCVKLSNLHIGAIDHKGIIAPRTSGWFFEWKCDWPGTREEHIASAKAEMRKRQKGR